MGTEGFKASAEPKIIQKDQLVEIAVTVAGAGIVSIPFGGSFGILGILFIWLVLSGLFLAFVVAINLIRRRLWRKRTAKSDESL